MRVVPTLQPFCYSFPVTFGFQRVSASRWTSQRVMEEECQGKQRDFLPSRQPICGMRLSQSPGWTAPWLSATSPHGDARQPWDADGRICGRESKKNWNVWGSAKQSGASGNSTVTSPPCDGGFNLLRGGNNTKPLVGTQATTVSTGLVYGLSLIRTEATGTATSAHRLRVCYRIEPNKLDISRCQFITGDALTELRKMPSATVNVVICSPPYWPVKRWYGGDGIGFEPTPKEYIHNLVGIFHEARRVLKNTGVYGPLSATAFRAMAAVGPVI